MPELPEVETIRVHLATALTGKRVLRAEIRDPLLTRPEPPEAVAAALEGKTILDVRRRGKYVILDLLGGGHLLVHLRMTGGFLLVSPPSEEEDPHRRATLSLDDGSDVTYRDVRRFGTWLLLGGDELEGYLTARLGPEPLGPAFSRARLTARLDGRRAPVKAALLDQRTAAGVGNIYADEALWRAGVHPRRAAASLRPEEVAALRRAIRAALRAGITRQGATLRDYRRPGGERGRMQDAFAVYGRDGEPCPRCRDMVAKTRVAGRGTWFCPRCQPENP
jgi:formamidopyrimidine-DNA glycosylase